MGNIWRKGGFGLFKFFQLFTSFYDHYDCKGEGEEGVGGKSDYGYLVVGKSPVPIDYKEDYDRKGEVDKK